MIARFVVLAVLGLLWSLVSGCAIVDTGPTVARTTVEATSGAARALLASYQPSEMTASVELGVNDPRYNVRTFVGTGVYVDMTLSLSGAEAEFDLASAGAGVPIDREFAQQATTIIGDSLLSEQARKDAIAAAVAAWLARRGATVDAPVEP